jgi:hypothetical protein
MLDLGYQCGPHERQKRMRGCGEHRARAEHIARQDRGEHLGHEKRGEARHTTYRAARAKRCVPRGGAVSARQQGGGRACQVGRSCAALVLACKVVSRLAGARERARGGPAFKKSSKAAGGTLVLARRSVSAGATSTLGLGCPRVCRDSVLVHEPFERAVRRGPGLQDERTCSVQLAQSPIPAAAGQTKNQRE